MSKYHTRIVSRGWMVQSLSFCNKLDRPNTTMNRVAVLLPFACATHNCVKNSLLCMMMHCWPLYLYFFDFFEIPVSLSFIWICERWLIAALLLLFTVASPLETWQLSLWAIHFFDLAFWRSKKPQRKKSLLLVFSCSNLPSSLLWLG